MSQVVPRSGAVGGAVRQHHSPGSIVRAARTALNWSQADLGRRCGYSASQVSRWETGRLSLRDVELLRTLADVLALPPAVFGLTTDDTAGRTGGSRATEPHRVGHATTPSAEEDDPVRRRAFLQLTAVTGTTLAWPGAVATDAVDPARTLAQRLGDVLLSLAREVEPTQVEELRESVVNARRDFTACRYLELADRLPTLIQTVEATTRDCPIPAAQQVLADTYTLATRALIKLEASGLEWIAADRALHAARPGEDPVRLAEAQRLVASVARRANDHDRAQRLTLAAADHLDIASRNPAPEHLVMYSTLYCSAGYAAARAADRDRAADLLAEAATAAGRLAEHPDQHRAVQANLVSHQVSASYVLGDAGTALARAHGLPLGAVPTTERRARLLVDTAMAYAQWDKPAQAYRTLLTAERIAPGEVRTRKAVRRLVGELMASPRRTGMPGLPDLAERVHLIA